MSTKRMLVALTLILATAGAAQGGPRRAYDATPSAGAGYQGEAPPWSFACINDTGYSECREPMWIYGK